LGSKAGQAKSYSGSCCESCPEENDVSKTNGIVYFIGAGPGDPELMTIKGRRLLQQADVVVYDRLVSREIVDTFPAGATRIYVGKRPGHHHMTQDEINELLVKLAQKQRKVVRLKGGDSFVFGRGSEEAGYLARHDVAFELVPGITSAAACSTYAGIPLTHRGLATGMRVVTGHCRSNMPLDLNWDSLADADTTLVVYMGLAQLQEISDKLIQAGLAADTPAAAIENGTTPRQRRCISTLAEIAQETRKRNFVTPTLIIIGRVVSLSNELDWFQRQAGELTGNTDAQVLVQAQA
jgi:uroporphyrin-III C-methyltransferase/precorrin-2 dehydrogenase/sirohydrochlorin ferrochelatase/uroporphyrin-III C-methyltransferase